MLCFLGFTAFLGAGWFVLQSNTTTSTRAKIGTLTNVAILSFTSGMFNCFGCAVGEVPNNFLGLTLCVVPSAIGFLAQYLRKEAIADQAAEEMWHMMVQEKFNADILSNEDQMWHRLTGDDSESAFVQH